MTNDNLLLPNLAGEGKIQAQEYLAGSSREMESEND